jgi:hypothetical protein
MKWLILVAAVLLAGCETTPRQKSPMERGIESKHELRQEPHRAAVCVARNIDEKRKALNARVRQGREPVLIEVPVFATGHLIALAQFVISGEGSIAVIWTTPELAQPRDELVAVMIQGC